MTPEIVQAAVRLADTLAAENAALIALDLPRAAAMLPDKQRALAAFEAARLLAPSHLAPGPRAEAEALAARLRDLAERNRSLLERAVSVQGEVIAMVARALPAPPDAGRYGAGGAAAAARAVPRALAARA